MAPSGFSEMAISRENEGTTGNENFFPATIFHRLTRITALVTRVSRCINPRLRDERRRVAEGEGGLTGSDGK